MKSVRQSESPTLSLYLKLQLIAKFFHFLLTAKRLFFWERRPGTPWWYYRAVLLQRNLTDQNHEKGMIDPSTMGARIDAHIGTRLLRFIRYACSTWKPCVAFPSRGLTEAFSSGSVLNYGPLGT
jgi:hypothetical protein